MQEIVTRCRIITVIDAGIGNFQSVANMISYLGLEVEICSKPKSSYEYTHLILPGVGSFDAGMEKLKKSGWGSALMEIGPETKLLGICLGMQLLTSGSEEGFLSGLNLVDATCIRFESKVVKVPHMGWNDVSVTKFNSLLPIDEPNQFFYFSHSFYVRTNIPEISTLKTTHDIQFDSGFESQNILGVQFHPEKSHKYGMQLLKNFGNL